MGLLSPLAFRLPAPPGPFYATNSGVVGQFDFFRFFPNKSGTVKAHVTATDTPLTVTEFDAFGNATSNTTNVAAGQTGDLTFAIPSGRREYIRIAKITPQE